MMSSSGGGAAFLPSFVVDSLEVVSSMTSVAVIWTHRTRIFTHTSGFLFSLGRRHPIKKCHVIHARKMLLSALRFRYATRWPWWCRHNHTSTEPKPAAGSPGTASFGFRDVPEESKEDLVKNVFDSVASSYDVMNDAMSLGVHRLWKDTLVSTLNPGRKGPMKCLDVAGGTGDIALRILDHAREKYADRETTVQVVDINDRMLKEGFKRFKKTMYHNSE